MLSAAKGLCREAHEMLRCAQGGCSDCQGLFFTIEPYLNNNNRDSPFPPKLGAGIARHTKNDIIRKVGRNVSMAVESQEQCFEGDFR
jgi:hypothetical protein